MIKSIHVSNFKSFKEATLKLTQLTMLIGPNASGKSNALEAIRLLSLMAKGQRFDDMTRKTGGSGNDVRGQAQDLFRTKKDHILLTCKVQSKNNDHYELRIKLGIQGGLLVVKEEEMVSLPSNIKLYNTHPKTSYHADDIDVAYNNYKRGPNKPIIKCSNRQVIFYQLLDSTRFRPVDEKSRIEIPLVTLLFKELLDKIIFLDPRPSSMRGYSFSKDNVINEDGSNLSSVLYQICLNPDDKAILLDLIRSLPEQDISDIEFIVTERHDVMVKLTETFGGKKRSFDATMLSDGTLRVLSIGGVLLKASPGSLVIIEEVDNGVHPSRARQLVNSIHDIAIRRSLQVLMSSHNPALLDAIPDESIGDVVCCYRATKFGDSKLERLSDIENYPELVAQGPLGSLMTMQVIERFIKDSTNQDDKRAKALMWLNELKSDGGE